MKSFLRGIICDNLRHLDTLTVLRNDNPFLHPIAITIKILQKDTIELRSVVGKGCPMTSEVTLTLSNSRI